MSWVGGVLDEQAGLGLPSLPACSSSALEEAGDHSKPQRIGPASSSVSRAAPVAPAMQRASRFCSTALDESRGVWPQRGTHRARPTVSTPPVTVSPFPQAALTYSRPSKASHLRSEVAQHDPQAGTGGRDILERADARMGWVSPLLVFALVLFELAHRISW